MGFGLKRRRKPKRRFTGIRPSIPDYTVPIRLGVTCVECACQFTTREQIDGEYIEVVACPDCKTIFNRKTGEILKEGGV